MGRCSRQLGGTVVWSSEFIGCYRWFDSRRREVPPLTDVYVTLHTGIGTSIDDVVPRPWPSRKLVTFCSMEERLRRRSCVDDSHYSSGMSRCCVDAQQTGRRTFEKAVTNFSHYLITQGITRINFQASKGPVINKLTDRPENVLYPNNIFQKCILSSVCGSACISKLRPTRCHTYYTQRHFK